MASSRANWDEATTKIFLDLCIVEKNQLNWSNKCLTKLGWQQVYRNFKQRTGLILGSKQLQNKWSTMRRSFMNWRDLQVQSGLDCDKHTDGVAADSTFWATDEGTSTAKPPPFLDELYMLFGHTTQDRGTLLTTGGVRVATPSMGTEDTPADILEDYVRKLSQTIAMRSQKRLSCEQEELDLAMWILEEDGIDEGSDLYCMVIYLCKNVVNRRDFIKMKTKESRLHWIQFNWERENK
uniref:Myb/SANT-like domain-containing protein n=1 Tax=Setaria italica TaxID=4555 RepID=K3YMM6_SETIT